MRHLNFSSPAALVSVSNSRILVFRASSTWLRVWASLLIPATDPVSSAVVGSVPSDSCWLELANDMGSSFTSTSAEPPLFCDAGITPSGLHAQERNYDVMTTPPKPKHGTIKLFKPTDSLSDLHQSST
jgi:hypothetical protein